MEHTSTDAALQSHAVVDWLLRYAVDLMHGDRGTSECKIQHHYLLCHHTSLKLPRANAAKELGPLSLSASRQCLVEELDKQPAEDVIFLDGATHAYPPCMPLE